MKQSLLSNLCVLGVVIFSGNCWSESAEKEGSQAAKETAPDEKKIKVIGRRNLANTEVDEDTQKLLKIPGIAGDPLAAVYSMPGVVIAGGDVGGEPAIRGSSPDDNAYYIDFMPAGYIFHAFGPSIFNENLVHKFELLPAAFGAQFGEATGGVIDVTLRDPRNQDFAGTFDWSFLQTGVMLESGITENQAFYFSARKSLLHLYYDEGEEDEGITVYEAPQSDDYQLKYQWLIGDNQKFTFGALGASDNARANISRESEEGRADPEIIGDIRIKQDFDSIGARWELFAENGGYLSLAVSRLNDSEVVSYGDGQFIDSSYEEDFFRGYYQRNWFKDHKLTIGAEIRKFDFDYRFDIIPYFCTDHQQDCNEQRGDRIQDSAVLNQTTNAVYVTNMWQVDSDLTLELGVRGEYNDYTEEKIWMPRAAVTWQATDALSLNTKAGKYSRFPNADTAIRKLGNPDIKSPRADHFSIGGKYEFSPLWQSSVDLYLKKMTNLPLALTEDDPDFAKHYSNDMSGRAHGVEFLVERDKADGWYGWASLSWSKSERTNDRTNETKEYYLDTPLMFNLVANYELNSHWEFGARLTIRSGQKYTPIIGLRDNENFEGHYLPVYGDLNSKTLPNYQRLDLQAEYKFLLWKMEAAWTFAIINALNHENVEGYYYAPDGNETIDNFKIAKEEGIGMFPAIGFKLHF
ncbi:TonB-dependent receptor [Aliikangiella coralliicola]|uniref:TonB-dependent receptor n=1 Tax=Aliikangiella coralliicola TaxID=2592383 RepID=A0A545UEK9_9GAMM|nr:TonB-dependent receptor [Aliikangiella coralliicola]TQV87914.1 TonB-dependent receptor [Aliikangiella coralliicola]